MVCLICVNMFHSHEDSEISELNSSLEQTSLASTSSSSLLPPTFLSSPDIETTHIETKFSLNGAINILDRNTTYFTVDRDVGLIDKIKERKSILFYGPRSVGKTTEAYNIINKLNKENTFFPMMVTLEFCYGDNGPDYWNSIIKFIKNKYRINFEGDNDFFFSNENKTIFNNKNVILFIDEFERLNENEKVLEFILCKFRAVLHEKEHYCLWSLVGIGPFDINYIGLGTNYSPFNISDSIECTTFSIEEVKNLFLQYETKKVVKVDPLVVDDIFELTNGHPGLTCLCGRLMDEDIKTNNSGKILYEQWLECQFKLEIKSSLYLTVEKMIDFLINSSYEIKKLAYSFVSTFPNPIYHHGMTRELRKLISIGFVQLLIEPIIIQSGTKCILSSRLIQICFFNRLPCIDTRFYEPITKLPTIGDNKNLDIPSFIQWLVPRFIAKENQSFKKNENGEEVPSESFYHFEMISCIKSTTRLLIEKPHVWPNVKTAPSGNNRVDILIRYKDKKYVIELSAHVSSESIKEHIERTNVYKKQCKADFAWSINFTTFSNDTLKYKCPDGVGFINVVHDLDFKCFQYHITNP
ncbi:hypothetical protein ACTFIZ_005963 [Dictyostelium cf. discoideum]